jgi:integrase
MEMTVRHVRRDKMTGILYYRRRFPKDLVSYIPSQSPTGRGRRELNVSLLTKDIDAPGAKDRLAETERDYLAIVEKARRVATGNFHRLDERLIRYLADNYLHEQLALDEAGRWGRSGPMTVYSSRRNPEEDYLESSGLLEAYDSRGLVAYWQDWARSYADEAGFHLNPADPEMPALCQALGEAACEIWLALDKRIDFVSVATPPAAEPPATVEATKEHTGALTLQAVAEALLESKVGVVSSTTSSAWGSALRFFREAHGTPRPSQITRLMVTEYIELLAQRPAKLPNEHRMLPLRELVAHYSDRTGVSRLSKKTIRASHLASLSAIWNKGEEAGLIEEGRANPFKSRRSLATSPEEDEGTEFHMSELQEIFSLPVFTSGERPAHGRGEACYWMPLILLTTGLRPEEAAQLLVSDFRQDDETGEWLMEITAEGTHPVKGKRSLKSKGRRFPVPPLLLSLGLPSYLTSLRSAGELAFFPKLAVNSRTHGYLAPSVAEWWSQYLKDRQVHLTPKPGKQRRPFRDFRTTWATAARVAKVPEEAMSYLMGHSNAGAVQTRTYGQKHAHADWMNAVSYPKLDLSVVRPWNERSTGSR